MNLHNIKKIAVIGGGLGGLSFALRLHQICQEQKIECPQIDILERDGKAEAKDFQNYSLSIRADSGGVQALKTLGVLTEVINHTSHATAGFYMASHTQTGFKLLFQGPPMDPENAGFRPVRFGLWKSLLDKLPDTIRYHWSEKAVQVTEDATKVHPIEVLTENGGKFEADFVVVADGSQSAIRRQYHPQEKVSFTGIVLLCGTSQRNPPKGFEGKHGLFVGYDGVAMFVGHEAEGKTIWGVTFLAPEPHTPLSARFASKEDREAVFQEALGKLSSWPDEMKEMVSAVDLETLRVVNGFDKFPHRSTGRVIFIGDANHPVTPFSANGANMALVDGVKLADALSFKSHKTIDDAIKAFHDEMIPRATAIVNQGRQTISMAHSTTFMGTTMRDTLLKSLGFVVAHPTAVKATLFTGVAIALGGLAYWLLKDKIDQINQ